MLAQDLKIEKMRNMIKEYIHLVKIVERKNHFATPRMPSSKAKLGQLDNVNTYKKTDV